MHKFVALPVGKGDAFYLARDNWSVLVDGGMNRTALPGLFTRHANQNGVDVLICTHNDADHANGVLGFLESGLSCKELWLPGQWIEGMQRVLAPIESVLSDLIGDVERASTSDSGSDISSLEVYARTITNNEENQEIKSQSIHIAPDGWAEEWQANLEGPDDLDFYPIFPYFFRENLFFKYMLGSDPSKQALLISAISAAKRIRNIAKAAYHRGIKVRWFAFDPENPKGGDKNLSPINSRELLGSVPTKPSQSILNFLALSVVNKKSLVFWSPGNNNDAGGVLFTADSDLADIRSLPCLNYSIVTSPHHGSEANKDAYQVVARSGCTPIGLTWVRSDARFQKRPGSTYLGMSEKKFCTICRLGTTGFTSKDAVELQGSSRGWQPIRASSKCQCS